MQDLSSLTTGILLVLTGLFAALRSSQWGPGFHCPDPIPPASGKAAAKTSVAPPANRLYRERTWSIPLHCPVQLQPFQPGCSLWQSCSSEISLTTAVLSLIVALHSVSYPCSLLAPWFPRGWKLIMFFELIFFGCSVGTSCQHYTTLGNLVCSVNLEVNVIPW